MHGDLKTMGLVRYLVQKFKTWWNIFVLLFFILFLSLFLNELLEKSTEKISIYNTFITDERSKKEVKQFLILL